jgi:hypothetical protein
MMSYRFARRAFIAGVGGAFGLKILLRNLELSAQGAAPPPRFLMLHWPVGTVRYRFRPTGSGTTYVTTPILKPFEDAGLRDQMAVLYGLHQEPTGNQWRANGGGGHEAGTPFTTTGANCPGCRRNNGEGDDAVAGGPSFDQIFLKNAPALQRPGLGYVNSICDARVDSLETSTQCLSYSYTMRQVTSTSGTQLSEATPLLPTLSPAQLYANLFSGFIPGGPDAGSNNTAVLTALRSRKSVLDYSLRQLDQVRTLAPAGERVKIDLHADAIRKIEMQLSQQILDNSGGMGGTGGGGVNCTVPAAPDPMLLGKMGSRFDYTNPATSTDDKDLHERIGNAHAGIIKAAFACDIIRVATFQWSPGTNHVSFGGMFPDDTRLIYMHHPLSHEVGRSADALTSQPTGRLGSVIEFLVNVQTWYNQKTAAILKSFKDTTDAFGGNLFDYTVFPYVTEVSQTTHFPRDPMPGIIFGGKALGMHPNGGQYINFETARRSHNDLWMTVAQAYLGANPQQRLQGEAFLVNGGAPIPGVWAQPM